MAAAMLTFSFFSDPRSEAWSAGPSLVFSSQQLSWIGVLELFPYHRKV
jgi:hypothetical protein